MAAPMDQLISYYEYADTADIQERNKMSLENIGRDTRIAEWYRALGQWSLRLSKYSQEHWKIGDAIQALKDVNKVPLRPYEKSPAYVVPETLAAITAYANRPGTRAGRYMSFDVGAGTTDISVFWLEKHDHVIKPWYYSSSSQYIGVDDIDRKLEDVLIGYEGHSLRSRREAYEADGRGLWRVKEFIQDVLAQIERHKKNTFGKAYSKESCARIWGDHNAANITVLMLGGGCQIDVIQNIAKQSVWENVLGPSPSESLSLHLTQNVLLPNGKTCLLRDIPSLLQQSYLMVIAEGLANKIIDISEYGIVSQPLYQRPKLNWNDYYIEHWW
jgi:hypothetical protein